MKEVAAFAKTVAIVNVDNLERFIKMKNDNLKDNCKYFSCHDLRYDVFDCRTCYCPFYDICSTKAQSKEKILFGGYLLPNNILACEKCSFIHRHDIVEYIYTQLEKSLDINNIYVNLEKIFLNERNDNINGKN